MKEGIEKPVYIVADDFTGANDVGVALASSGVETQVLLTPEVLSDKGTAVRIICTDSRDLDKQDAKAELAQISKRFHLAEHQTLLIKKVDSTLRGNVGSEIEALIDTGYDLAIVAIAAPIAKRKTVNGLCYVNDTPLSETEFASDPKSPITSSRIVDILGSQTTSEMSEYLQSDHNNDPHEQHFNKFYESGTRIVVCDANSNKDLLDLYQAAAKLSIPTVFVTTGELTQAIVDNTSTPTPETNHTQGPVLAIIGSMSQTTFKQTQFLLDNKIAQVVELELEALLSSDCESYLQAKSSEAIQWLNSNHNCVIRSCKDPEIRHELSAIAAQHNLSQKALAEHVRNCLAELATQIIATLEPTQKLGGMILCGGDIAIATAQKLNAPTYNVGGIVADCVPWGTLDSELTQFPIFTKAGGFGDASTFSKVIQHLNKEVK